MFEIENFLIVAVALALITFMSSPTIGDCRGSRHLQFGSATVAILRRSVLPGEVAKTVSKGMMALTTNRRDLTN